MVSEKRMEKARPGRKKYTKHSLTATLHTQCNLGQRSRCVQGVHDSHHLFRPFTPHPAMQPGNVWRCLPSALHPHRGTTRTIRDGPLSLSLRDEEPRTATSNITQLSLSLCGPGRPPRISHSSLSLSLAQDGHLDFHTALSLWPRTATSTFTQLSLSGPGRPPRLSHSSLSLAQDGHLDFHTALSLSGPGRPPQLSHSSLSLWPRTATSTFTQLSLSLAQDGHLDFHTALSLSLSLGQDGHLDFHTPPELCIQRSDV